MKRWTPRLAAARSNARIGTMEKALLGIAYQWGDVNQYVVDECDRLRDELSALREAIADAVAAEQERASS